MGVGWDKAWKCPGRRNAEFVLLPEAGTGCTQLSKLPTPVQMDSDSVGLGASMADLAGGGVPKIAEAGTEPREWVAHGEGTSPRLQLGLAGCRGRKQHNRLSAKPGRLSKTPRTHMVEGESSFCTPLASIHLLCRK